MIFLIFSLQLILQRGGNQEGIEVLTGVKAGKRKKDGTFRKNTLNYRIDKRLKEMAEKLSKYPPSRVEKKKKKKK